MNNPYESPNGLAEGKWYLDPIRICQTIIWFLGMLILCYIFYPIIVILGWKNQTRANKVFHGVMIVAWFFELGFFTIVLLGKEQQVVEFLDKWSSKIFQ